MKKIALLGVVLLVIAVTALTTASASEETFAEDYIANYIRMFGQDKYDMKAIPLTGEMYTADYIEMFGEDTYAMKITPLDADSYAAGYIRMFGEEKYALHNNMVPAVVAPTPDPTPELPPQPRPTPLPDGYWDSFLPVRDAVWNNVPSFSWLYS
ncbi:MAG: hypothetical protein LUQ37_06395 [Methanoregulaceae archaeon]|jgi:hypothetical protein|nr:hypothetical protein [Methanoregulaceae archaeon]